MIDQWRHDGPITAVATMGSLVATGGRDRCIRAWRIDDSMIVDSTPLLLTLRCRGAILDGVQGPAERALLQQVVELEISDT